MRLSGHTKNRNSQVFVAFDWLNTYDAETKKTMMGHCALEFLLDGNELFGRA